MLNIVADSVPARSAGDEMFSIGDQPACPSQAARLAIPLFVVLPPLALPRPDELPLGLPPAARKAAEAVLSGRNAGLKPEDLLRLLDIAAAESVSASDQTAVAGLGSSVHDSYFRVDRYTGAHPAAAFLHSLLAGYALFLREVIEGGTTLPSERLAAIDCALATMLMRLLGLWLEAAPPQTMWPQAGTAPSALRRWIRGHQVFAVMTQGLIVAVDQLAARVARTSGDEATHAASLGAIETAVEEIVVFFEGSAGALCFTGDFSPAEYCGAIRATMEPPHVPDGFSGVLAADHRVLVNRLKAMRPHWAALRKHSPASHARLTEVLASVYEDHKHVCAQFVGTDRPSLLTVNGAEQTSSTEQLEKFRRSRLRLLGMPRMAASRCPFPA